MGNVRKFLKAEYWEDGKIIWLVVEIILMILVFFLKNNSNYGIAVLAAGMYFGAYIVASFHIRFGVETLLLGNSMYQRKKGMLFLNSCIFHNLLLEIAIFAYLLLTFKISLVVIFYGIILCIFTNAIGMFIGFYIRNEIKGVAVCVFLVGINFLKIIVQEEYLRYFSPIVQIGNMKTLQWWNLLVLLIIAGMIITVMIYRERKFILVGIAAILLIVIVDIQQHSKISSVPAEYETYAGDILNRINDFNKDCGMEQYDDIVIYKKVYYPWMSNQDKRVFYKKDDTLYMNCFTEYLCNLEEKEIVTRWSATALKPNTRLQMAMEDLYNEYFFGNIDYVEQFIYKNQIKSDGTIYSKNYALAADTLLTQKEAYGELYLLTKEYKDDEKVLKIWRERSNFQ